MIMFILCLSGSCVRPKVAATTHFCEATGYVQAYFTILAGPNFLLPVGNLSCANIETLPHPKECRQAQHTLQGCSKPNMNLREILWLFL